MLEEIIIEKDNNNDVENYVKFNLHKYNEDNCNYIKQNSSYAHNNKINGDFIIYDGKKIIGGALGIVMWAWYYLTDFYIDKKYRNLGIGKKVIEQVENFAKRNNALGVRIDSWNFQAPKFYQKLGYKIWGKFDDCPPGTTHYYMYKKF